MAGPCCSYRGPNKLVGGSQFRTLIRDTDAPYNCSECDGLKAFIRNLQREQRALRDHCEDLELKVVQSPWWRQEQPAKRQD